MLHAVGIVIAFPRYLELTADKKISSFWRNSNLTMEKRYRKQLAFFNQKY